jgi:hypothetical protein
MNIHSVYKVFFTYFRRKRMHRFEKILQIADHLKVLDVGGTQFNWQFIKSHCSVTIVNLEKPGEWDASKNNFTFEAGDGTKLPYHTKSFDVVYSNSVIEHLGTLDHQRAFANECTRVGKCIWVQTPSKYFPIEPHLITPCIHWLPVRWQAKLMRNFTVWGLITRPTKEYIDNFLKERRLLSYGEMKTLFHSCRIMKERFFFITKSYIAIRLE